MKKLEIIIRPSALDNVKDKLASLDIHGMTCTEVRGFGRQRGHTEVYRAAVYQVDFVAKIRLEIVVHDSMTESVVQAVMEAARTGNVGDGKIFVTPVEKRLAHTYRRRRRCGTLARLAFDSLRILMEGRKAFLKEAFPPFPTCCAHRIPAVPSSGRRDA